ncbi:hypothetical protein Tco_0179789 [Tanacetum coccineum]
MSMTIPSDVKDKILATPSETSKVENAPAEMLRDLDQQMEKRVDDGCTLWIKLYSKYEYEIRYHPGRANVVIDALRKKERVKPRRGMMRMVVMDEARASRFRWMIYLMVLADATESVSDAIRFEYCLASSSGCTNVGKGKPKATGDRQKSYADNRHKPLEFEVGDRVMLKVSHWKGDIHFGKKGKLAPRQFLFDELRDRVVNEIVTQLKVKLLAIRYLVKVSWNSKGNFELTWVWEDYLKDKYPRLIVWLVKPLVLTYESVVMYGLCVYMRYVDCVRVGNQSIERYSLIGIGLVMDLVKFLSFTFGGKEITFVVLAFLR